MDRNMMNATHEDAVKSGWNIMVDGSLEVVCKAVYEKDSIRIMKSTKRLPVPGGFIYNTSTEIHNGSNVSVAEAVCFVPYVKDVKAIG